MGNYRFAVFRPPLISAFGGLGLKPGRSILPLTGGFFATGLPETGFLGGGAVGVALGGTARTRHLGPEPMRSSRWA